MADDQLQVGDTVRLKSGGPLMTISSIQDEYGTMQAWCEWFDDKKAPQARSFALTSIIKD